jgi:uncharacterized low-complexity protein
MKKQHFFGLALAIALSLASQLVNAQTVYATANGKKFHKKNCTLVNEGKKGMELTEAKKAGLTPCGACKPDDSPADKPKKKK